MSGGLPTEFRIWRRGLNTTANGYDVLFDAKAAKAVMAAYAKHGAEIMIDLEHLSLDDSAPNYDPDARGWCRLELRNGELWATDVRWTPDGERRLGADKTQRYFSPAFALDDESRPIRLFNIALVAMPGTDNLEALVAASERVTMGKITFAELRFVKRVTARLSALKFRPDSIIRTLAEGEEGGDSGGEVAGVDIAALADFLGISVDPAQDPAGFVKELLAKLDEISGKVRGAEEAAPAAEAETVSEEPKEEVAAAKAIMRVVGAKTATDALITVTEWRQLALEHEKNLKKLADERAALDATKRRSLTARLVTCGAELPSTAWADEAKTKPAKHLAVQTLEELEQRCLSYEAVRGQNGPKTPDRQVAGDAGAVETITIDGVRVELSAEEVKRCKAKGADLEAYARIKARQGRTAPVKLEG